MHSATFPESLKLHGVDRARYFAPVVFFAFLACLCLAMIAVSAFVVTLRAAIAIAVAGLFGFLATGGAGALVLRLQLRWLRYTAIPTAATAEAALAAVRTVVAEAGWKVAHESTDSLEARTPGGMFVEGERIYVEIRPHEVLVASICDPNVGFSLVGQERCRQHCQRVRQAICELEEPFTP